jgi:hypothetical protein
MTTSPAPAPGIQQRLRALSAHLGHLAAPAAAASGDPGSGGGGSTGGDDDDVVGSHPRIPLFCMGDVPFDAGALDKNGFTSVSLTLFEPRFRLMAKQILDSETGEKTFGYIEESPPTGADGHWDFTGQEGVLVRVVWHRWLERDGPGGPVAIEIVAQGTFRVLSQQQQPSGVDGAPPLVLAEVELDQEPQGSFEAPGGELIDVAGLSMGEAVAAAAEEEEEEEEYTQAQAAARTGPVEVRARSRFQGIDRTSQQKVWAYEVCVCHRHRHRHCVHACCGGCA